MAYQGSLESLGQTTPIREGNSALHIGKQGEVLGRKFEVVGRVRYGYEDGYWDEWNVLLDTGAPAWIHEDEGEFSAFDRRHTAPGQLNLDVGAGSNVAAFGDQVFATEVGRARVVSGEGQILSELGLGKEFPYVDGLYKGADAILLSGERHHILFLGSALEFGELKLA